MPWSLITLCMALLLLQTRLELLLKSVLTGLDPSQLQLHLVKLMPPPCSSTLDLLPIRFLTLRSKIMPSITPQREWMSSTLPITELLQLVSG